jgi:hypothetical protein
MDGQQENRYPSGLFSIPYAAVAQWIEYWPPKPRVVGSIPASRATYFFLNQEISHCDVLQENAICHDFWHCYCAKNVPSIQL